ncbi:MAG TPA: DMT family transporter, partial [Planctomycetota bacterium]|nr:DMT family transporter [Planctomycetota bacterium]
MDAATRRLLIAVQICFGVFPILGKIALAGFQPRAVLVWRLAAGSVVLLAIAAARHGRAVLPSPRDLAQLLGLSLLGVILNQLLFLEGLKRSTAVNAGLLMTVIPVATTAIAVLLRRELLRRRRALGMSLSVAGVATLFLHRGADVGGQGLRGDLFMTLNAISYSFFLVLAKPVLTRVPQLVVVAWLFLFGLLFVPWFARDVAWVPDGATRAQWLALGGVLLFPTVLAYLLNTIVLARTHASTTAAYVMLQPFISTVLGIVMLGEKPGWNVALPAAGVLLGLWLVSTGPRRDPRAPAPAAAPGAQVATAAPGA